MSRVLQTKETLVTADFIHNPYPAYARLREQASLVWSDEFFQGAWLVTRHADVERALRDPRLSAQRTGGWVNGVQDAGDDARVAQRAFQRFFARAFLFLDDPDHQRLRKVLMPAFRPQRLETLQPHISTWCRQMVQDLDGEFDFMQRIARPLPAKVIAHLMGVPLDLEDTFTCWAEGLAAFIGAAQPTARQLAVAQSCLREMLAYFEQDLLPVHRHTLPCTDAYAAEGDMVHDLLRAEKDGRINNHAELLAQCAMLLFAGYETTRNLLGNGMLALMRNREQWDLLCRQPDLAPQAVRELLRYDSPVQWTGRRAAQDFAWHGQAIRRGELVILLIGAANRDPQRHTAPDTLHLQRSQIGALSFGSGSHVCIGAGLTQMEAQTMFSMLAQACPDLQLAAEPARDGNPVYRGLRSLPMRKMPSTELVLAASRQ